VPGRQEPVQNAKQDLGICEATDQVGSEIATTHQVRSEVATAADRVARAEVKVTEFSPGCDRPVRAYETPAGDDDQQS